MKKKNTATYPSGRQAGDLVEGRLQLLDLLLVLGHGKRSRPVGHSVRPVSCRAQLAAAWKRHGPGLLAVSLHSLHSFLFTVLLCFCWLLVSFLALCLFMYAPSLYLYVLVSLVSPSLLSSLSSRLASPPLPPLFFSSTSFFLRHACVSQLQATAMASQKNLGATERAKDGAVSFSPFPFDLFFRSFFSF